MLVTFKRGVEAGGASSAGHEDSDLERKRREAEALLQSVGITPDIPHGKPAEQACSVYCPVPQFTLWWYDGVVVTSNFTVWLGFRHHRLLHHTSHHTWTCKTVMYAT